jgi:hypothetical protein
MGLAARQYETEGVAQSIRDGVDLGDSPIKNGQIKERVFV